MSKYQIGIIGATGYTGSELVRLLSQHPEVVIDCITSESRAGELFSDVHPQFRGIVDIQLIPIQQVKMDKLDVVFLALPHGVSMEFVKVHSGSSCKIIDLSGDFRLSSKSVYESWYQKEHSYEAGFDQAVFGLPELFEAQIKGASLVANPGCFPTASSLAVAPLLRAGLADSQSIIIDAKTGVTGAGIKASKVTHFPNVNDNFKAYGVKTHRHTIEIQETVNRFSEQDTKVLFTPHLLPVDRGILATCYLQASQPTSDEAIRQVFEQQYAKCPFVRLVDEVPNLKQVRGTNYIDIYATYDDRTSTIIVISVIDNLVKGAAGQAIQNMNIILELDQTTGLNLVPLQP